MPVASSRAHSQVKNKSPASFDLDYLQTVYARSCVAVYSRFEIDPYPEETDPSTRNYNVVEFCSQIQRINSLPGKFPKCELNCCSAKSISTRILHAGSNVVCVVEKIWDIWSKWDRSLLSLCSVNSTSCELILPLWY